MLKVRYMRNNDAEETGFKKCKILAVSSSGGHWSELLRLQPAFEGQEVVYVTTQKDCQSQVPHNRLYVIPDANRDQWFKLIGLIGVMFIITLRERPDVVISTGAAPGYFALRFGRWFGARTLWLDSIANAEELSLSGRLVKPYADLLLTQWPHLEALGGPAYRGGVL